MLRVRLRRCCALRAAVFFVGAGSPDPLRPKTPRLKPVLLGRPFAGLKGLCGNRLQELQGLKPAKNLRDLCRGWKPRPTKHLHCHTNSEGLRFHP